MGTVYRNTDKICATCVYWGGERKFELNVKKAVVSFNNVHGICSNERSSSKKTSVRETHRCDKFEIHPSIR